jgi:hypothetical protein
MDLLLPGQETEEGTIGVVVNAVVSNNFKGTTLFNGTGPTIYTPRLATVTLRYQNPSGAMWSQDYAMKTTPQFFPVPGPLFISQYSVHAEPGVVVSSVPIVFSRNKTGEIKQPEQI